MTTIWRDRRTISTRLPIPLLVRADAYAVAARYERGRTELIERAVTEFLNTHDVAGTPQAPTAPAE